MSEHLNARQWDAVNDLTNTSVEDAHSSLSCSLYTEPVLRKCLEISQIRGEKTKVKLFTSALKKLEKRQAK
jgi:hypothetical protein